MDMIISAMSCLGLNWLCVNDIHAWQCSRNRMSLKEGSDNRLVLWGRGSMKWKVYKCVAAEIS